MNTFAKFRKITTSNYAPYVHKIIITQFIFYQKLLNLKWEILSEFIRFANIMKN